MVTFWERAANSVNRIFSFIVYIYDFSYFLFGIEERILVLIVSGPCHCLRLTFLRNRDFPKRLTLYWFKH